MEDEDITSTAETLRYIRQAGKMRDLIIFLQENELETFNAIGRLCNRVALEKEALDKL